MNKKTPDKRRTIFNGLYISGLYKANEILRIQEEYERTD